MPRPGDAEVGACGTSLGSFLVRIRRHATPWWARGGGPYDGIITREGGDVWREC